MTFNIRTLAKGHKITEPGAYLVDETRYHAEEICDSLSISSSGLKTILNCPVKYWHDSPITATSSKADGQCPHRDI